MVPENPVQDLIEIALIPENEKGVDWGRLFCAPVNTESALFEELTNPDEVYVKDPDLQDD